MSEATDIAEMDFAPAGPSQGIATPWARFWAKMFDLWLATSVVLALWYAAIYFAARSPALAPTVTAMFNQPSTTTSTTPSYLWNLVFFFIAMGVDATVQGTFGSTIGLKIIGARLERYDHTRPSVGECFKRNLGVLIFGFWLGFLAFVPMIINYMKANKGELMEWDKTAQTRVFNYNGNVWRTTLAAICLLALITAHLTVIAGIASMSK